MSEFINNSEMRKQTIKDIIKQLHEGKLLKKLNNSLRKHLRMSQLQKLQQQKLR